MGNEDLKKIIEEQTKPLCAPYGCQISLQDKTDGEIKLKLVCPPLDIFKVKGKVVKMEDELKNKITERLVSLIKNAKIKFV